MSAGQRSKVWPDSLAHPVSIAVLTGLTGRSWWLRWHGRLRWKGRDLPGPGRT